MRALSAALLLGIGDSGRGVMFAEPPPSTGRLLLTIAPSSVGARSMATAVPTCSGSSSERAERTRAFADGGRLPVITGGSINGPGRTTAGSISWFCGGDRVDAADDAGLSLTGVITAMLLVCEGGETCCCSCLREDAVDDGDWLCITSSMLPALR